jgi:hypothetical protein
MQHVRLESAVIKGEPMKANQRVAIKRGTGLPEKELGALELALRQVGMTLQAIVVVGPSGFGYLTLDVLEQRLLRYPGVLHNLIGLFKAMVADYEAMEKSGVLTPTDAEVDMSPLTSAVTTN